MARQEYLELSKSKKKPTRKIRSYLRRDLERIRRDMGYVEAYREAGYGLTDPELAMYETIKELYRQQRYMFDNKTHTVEDRIISLSRIYVPLSEAKQDHRLSLGQNMM